MNVTVNACLPPTYILPGMLLYDISTHPSTSISPFYSFDAF